MTGLSACLIVKNEEKNIANCLRSIKKLADQIVIVDTGSSDSTKEICADFGAEIYDFNWVDDFSLARNFSLQKAKGDWILWMDADEELVIYDLLALEEELLNSIQNMIALDMIHYYGSYPITSEKAHHSVGYRLFKNHKNFHFIGKIHERLDLSLHQQELPEFTTSFAQIKHYGYMDETVMEKEKIKRNLTLLLKEKKCNNDPWICYHLAAEYCRIYNYEKAYDEIQQSLMGFLKNNRLPPALLYKLKYYILLSSESFDDSILTGLDKAIMLYRDYVDLHFYKGLVFLNQKNYEKAIEIFFDCLDLDEKNIHYLILKGTGSFLAWYYIGICHEKMGNKKKAKKAYDNLYKIAPDFDIKNIYN